MIKKLKLHNFKQFEDLTLELDGSLNIIVGDNETGKSTILEAIALALSKKLNGRYIDSDLSPFVFNMTTVETYLRKLKEGENPEQPEVYIELYFDDTPEVAELKGTNNSLREDAPGVRVLIEFDDEYSEELESLLTDRDQIAQLPVEYYKVHWRSFADNEALTQRRLPVKSSLINASAIKLYSGVDYFLQSLVDERLDTQQRVALAVAYRRLREEFTETPSIKNINAELKTDQQDVTDKTLTLSLDVSQKSKWETNLVFHLDELPLQYTGDGEQNALKILLALEKDSEGVNVVLVEEPECHQSYSSMNRLVTKVEEKCSDKQLIIATHSSYVLNKLGLDKLILVRNQATMRLANLTEDTQDYFKKLSGFDTLRLILAKRAILVEGPSDELVVQKAYLLKHKHLPIQDGTDVINVRGLSFKRFLEISRELSIRTTVVTDNDGNFVQNVKDRYSEYADDAFIQICADEDDNAGTLEPQIVKCNELSVLNAILARDFSDDAKAIAYMEKHKTECALKLFETDLTFSIPMYIEKAVDE